MAITSINEEVNNAVYETIKNRMKLMMTFIGRSLKLHVVYRFFMYRYKNFIVISRLKADVQL